MGARASGVSCHVLPLTATYLIEARTSETGNAVGVAFDECTTD